MSAITTITDRVLHWALDARRATYGLAIMRMGFGAMTLVILALYLTDYSYSFGEGSRWGEALYKVSSANSFVWPISELFSRYDADPFTYLKVAVLAAAAVAYTVGWRMRIISPLFVVLWLGYISVNPLILNTGHYQTFRVMLLFLLFADTSYRWSLDSRRRRVSGERTPFSLRGRSLPEWVPILSNNFAVILVAAQLCIIYFSSALWKLKGTMWESGSAVYYTLRLEQLTLAPWLNDIVWQITPLVILASWASVYMQLLFPFTLLNRWTRMGGLIIITGMHAGIAVLLALPWFSLVMILSDMIFVRDRSWRLLSTFMSERWESRRFFRGERRGGSAGGSTDEPAVGPYGKHGEKSGAPAPQEASAVQSA